MASSLLMKKCRPPSDSCTDSSNSVQLSGKNNISDPKKSHSEEINNVLDKKKNKISDSELKSNLNLNNLSLKLKKPQTFSPSKLEILTAQEIEWITGDFSKSKIVISQENWTTYRGELYGNSVAVHRIGTNKKDVELVAKKFFSLKKKNSASKAVAFCPENGCIVMEIFKKSQNLREKKENEGIKWVDCCKIAFEICSGIQYLKKEGIPINSVDLGAIFLDEDFFKGFDKFTSKFLYSVKRDRFEKHILISKIGILFLEILMNSSEKEIQNIVFLIRSSENSATKKKKNSSSGRNLQEKTKKLLPETENKMSEKNVSEKLFLEKLVLGKIDPRMGIWPEDVKKEFVKLTMSCLNADKNKKLTWKSLVGDLTHIMKMATEAEKNSKNQRGKLRDCGDISVHKRLINNFSDDVCLLSSKQILSATSKFSPSNIVAEGGFSVVYKGRLNGVEVAVKKLIPHKSICDFNTEVMILHNLRHPHILSLIGFDPKTPCLVSEYMEGGSLDFWLEGKQKCLTWEDKVRISREISSAVLYMHSRNIIHCDLKLQNVLLSRHKQSKICDMGLAKAFIGCNTSVSTMLGTSGYLDPHALNTGYVDFYSDTYALGLIILQLLTGVGQVSDIHQLLKTYQFRPSSLDLSSSLDEIDTKSENEKDNEKDVEEDNFEDSFEYSSKASEGYRQQFHEESFKESFHETFEGSFDESSEDSFASPFTENSRWNVNPETFTEIVQQFCKNLDPESTKIPRESLWKTVGLLLRCVETTGELRPRVDDLVSSLQELEVLSRSGK